ncbi:MAG: hypothetical protein IJ025_00395 [Clostridia bacterium]|nr:hypothetical protein [Clostridia bacterium]
MRLRKKLFFVILAVLLVLSSCQRVPKQVVEANNEDLTSFLYNGVEYVEREYTSTDKFRPLLSDYSLADFEYNLLNREVYFIDELFIADKRDINQNYIYAYSGILGNTVYERKDFKTPKLADN